MNSDFLRKASRLSELPILRSLSPAQTATPSKEDLAGYLKAQHLAEAGAREIASYIDEGWSEKQAADLLDTWLHDHGVKSFFHRAFAWFGERTKFKGVRRKNYWEFLSGQRVIAPGEVYILDVAPIYQGYICDIGYTACLGENQEFEKAKTFLNELRDKIPELFSHHKNGEALWHMLDGMIRERGYENIHQIYPYSVLGHRIYKTSEEGHHLNVINFGWQSFWSILSRGVFGQLLNQHHNGTLTGLWAIEPHIGAKDFGAKFEEILVVEEDRCYWLDTERKGL